MTQKELSRLTCRRDAGATIFSHDLRVVGLLGNFLSPLRRPPRVCLEAARLDPIDQEGTSATLKNRDVWMRVNRFVAYVTA
ncbi:MAG: hypothetical protein DMG09_17540 [Acidobacteria bacterium]|nr:MAG: hypothetical protein DMG09_17540 [Acidobacteriota bacterium]